MTPELPVPPLPEMLEAKPVDPALLSAINAEIPEVLDFLATIQDVDVEGVEPYDVVAWLTGDGLKAPKTEDR